MPKAQIRKPPKLCTEMVKTLSESENIGIDSTLTDNKSSTEICTRSASEEVMLVSSSYTEDGKTSTNDLADFTERTSFRCNKYKGDLGCQSDNASQRNCIRFVADMHSTNFPRTSMFCKSTPSLLGKESSARYVESEDNKELKEQSRPEASALPVPDIFRTGAKCVPGENQDPHEAGVNYHSVGLLRTKPGRGEPTLSMSCSDKIMKWCCLGLQGGFLSNFLKSPIYLSSIIFSKCPFNEESVKRAVSLRGRKLDFHQVQTDYMHTLPRIYRSSLEFEHNKEFIESSWKPENGLGKPSASGSGMTESLFYSDSIVSYTGIRCYFLLLRWSTRLFQLIPTGNDPGNFNQSACRS